MRLPSPFRLAVIVVAIAALTVPLAAGGSLSTTSFSGTVSRTLYATDASGRLLTFSAAFPTVRPLEADHRPPAGRRPPGHRLPADDR